MELGAYFKSIVEQDQAPVVICDTEHIIIYMNPAAVERYGYAGGTQMVGRSIFDCHGPKTCELMQRILEWFMESPQNNSVYEGPGSTENKDVYMVALRDDAGPVIGYYEKHEYHDKETRPTFWPVA